MTRKEIIRLLEEGDYPALIGRREEKRNLPSLLISLTYDKEKLLCWRSIEAIGLLVAEISKTDSAGARNLAQRILWMMRDESGNNAWSAPEMLGEIVRDNPEEFSDIAPIIASFHDEQLFRRGVLRAILRIAELRPDLVRSSAAPLVGEYLRDPDVCVKAYAVLVAGRLRLVEFVGTVSELCGDQGEAVIYRDGEFITLRIGHIAEETVILLRAEGE